MILPSPATLWSKVSPSSDVTDQRIVARCGLCHASVLCRLRSECWPTATSRWKWRRRSLMRPRDLKLIMNLAPQNERALEIAGAGYSRCVGGVLQHVITLDPDPICRSPLRRRESVGSPTKAVSTAAVDGWKDEGPYDVILLNGSAEIVPETWLAQLAPNGRLGVIVRHGAAGSARIYTRAGDTSAYRSAFDAAPPVAPGLMKPASFAF